MSEFEILEGFDICEVERIAKDLRQIPTFASEFCAEEEIERCDQRRGLRRDQEYASLWASKEAVVKAVSGEIFNGREIIIRGDQRRAQVVLVGKALEKAEEIGIFQIKLSFAFTRTQAAAKCLALRKT